MSRGDFPSAKQDQFVLRFPDGLRDKIKASAEAEGRSMNSEIVVILQRHYAKLAEAEGFEPSKPLRGPTD